MQGRKARAQLHPPASVPPCLPAQSWYTATATVNVQKLFPKLLKLLSNKMSKDCILVIANFLGKYRVTVIYNELYLLFLFVLRMHHVVVT